ncbi:GNAT family N-acetyltransferase [Ktedonospora formicarum]|uniref:N-acetyltransferase n=1 Tax=Ktedonospora formicarum TaxID=2778364 RepID=A0A8J3MTD4_9CHLR|nr:GNAT family N-acetyltransferase [Ktedonospora formicarum]GHO47020.1 N-acetyltransferase [Ktedonospora formicarum]
MIQEWHRGMYVISTDKNRLDLQVIHRYLTTSYWAQGIPLETVRRSLEHALTFGLYLQDQQVGFAKIITDYATFAYVADVFILDPYQGQGLGTWLMETVKAHPDLQGLRRWVLSTKDAHALYQKVGFTALHFPERFMEVLVFDIYLKEQGTTPDSPPYRLRQ